MSRHDRPIVRVQRAMRRISRDRWIHPDDVERILSILVDCAHPRPCTRAYLSYHAIPFECTAVGMLRGQPPAFASEPEYGEILTAVKNLPSRRGDRACPADGEIAILRIEAKRVLRKRAA